MKNTQLFNFGKYFFAILLSASVLFLTSCGDDEEDEPTPSTTTSNLYETMKANSNLSQLSSFIDANADLKAALESTDPTTFFAPTDAAFDNLKLLLGVDDLNSVAPQVIEDVLKFHVVAGQSLSAAQLIDAGSATTVQGEDVVMNPDGTIATGGSNTMVEVSSPDVAATNGTMHVVGTILIPPTIFATIGANLGKLSQAVFLSADFTTLAAAIAKADEYAATNSLTTITSVLTGEDDYTVFAPGNAVFEAASITLDTYDGMTWYGIITNHAVPGIAAAGDISLNDAFTTVAGGTLTVTSTDAPTDPDNGILTGIVVTSANGQAQVAVGDAFSASNGVVHAIAGVLVP